MHMQCDSHMHQSDREGGFSRCHANSLKAMVVCSAMTSHEVNQRVQVVRRWFEEVFNEENMETLAEIASEDLVVNDPCSWGEPYLGRERVQKVIEEYIVAYKSLTFCLDSVLAEADGSQVLAKWTAQAMHLGTFMGAPASGRVEKISGMTSFQLAGRKIKRVDCFRQALVQERQNAHVDFGL